MKQELRLSGTGGQGLITAGIILAEAALLDGKLAIQSQSYGPEARGGASKAEVIISDEAIHFPKVTDPNLLLAMSQEAATKYSHDLTAGSVMITDSLFRQRRAGLRRQGLRAADHPQRQRSAWQSAFCQHHRAGSFGEADRHRQ